MSTTYTFGSYTCVQFTTTDGSFTWTPPSGVTSYDVLIVAGGGSGGRSANGGGGGGAGGLLWLTSQSCTPGVGISGSVGAGGATKTTDGNGNNGTNSVFGASTAIGGGGGAGTNVVGVDGGSGGGGAPGGAGVNWAGGAGTTGQGNAGGTGAGNSSAGQRAAGGGGGKGGAGDNAGTLRAGLGGAGFDATTLVGTTVGDSGWFASGGGGGSCSDTPESTSGNVSSGGGGLGGRGDSARAAGAGMAATGGGGGGGGGNDSSGSDQTNGAAGGSGVVIVRYATPSNEVAVAATLPKPTLAVGLSTDLEADLSVAGTLPKPVLDVALTAESVADLSVAGTLPKPTLAVDLRAGQTVEVEGTLPKPTLAVTLDAEFAADLSVAGTLPKPTLAVDLTAEVTTTTATVAGTLPKPTLAVSLEAETVLEADTSNLDDGIWLGDAPLSEIVWEPDVVPPPVVIGPQVERDVRVSAQTIDTPPANFGLATFTPGSGQLEYATAMRPRLLIGDEDWSFYNDVPAVIDNLHFIDPLKYGSGQVTLPGINPQYPPAALGDLDAYFKTKRVRIQLVIDGDPATIANPDYYKGFVTRVDTSGTELSLMLGGEAAGRLSAYGPVPPMVYRRRQHIDHILRATFLDARVRYHKADPDDSPVLIRRGGADAAALVQEHIAIWAAATETALTVTPGDDGIYRMTVKDTETIAATAYLDSSLITQSLAQDFMEQYNSVYVRGETPRGELIANIKTPGLTQGPPLDFPLASGVLEDGMTNADTTTGAGVTTLQQALAIHDFFDWEDGVAGTFESTLEAAVRAFQRFARLTVTGTVDEQTWNRLFRLDRIGYSLDDAREYPTASDPRLDRYLRTANGSKYAANPDFDGHVLPVGLWIDGGRMTKRAAEKLAVSKLAPEGGVWVGQLTLRSGLVRGDHTPGDPITSADVMDRREVEENMLVKVPWFAGSGTDGIVFHISGKDDGPEETTLLVSTLPTPTMETFAAMERLQEAKSNIGRLWSGGVRQSQVRQDQTTSWDTSSGWIARDRNLPGGEWTEIVVPAGQSGIVQRIDVETEDAVAAAFVLSQEPLGLARLNTIDPLANTGDDIWTEDEDIDAWFRRRGVIKAWGWWQQPGGYSPGKKSSGGSPTGKTRERAGIDYTTGRDPVLYLYAFVPTSTVLLAGRILRNHRTTDY